MNCERIGQVRCSSCDALCLRCHPGGFSLSPLELLGPTTRGHILFVHPVFRRDVLPKMFSAARRDSYFGVCKYFPVLLLK